MSKGKHVSPSMFGGNLLFDRDEIGPGTFDDAVSHLNIQTLRYPGGQIAEDFFDISNPNRTTTIDPTTGNSVSLLPITDFFSFCEKNKFKVDIVIPTRNLINRDMAGNPSIDHSEIQKTVNFVEQILQGSFGAAVVQSFEIGNEYWKSGEMDAQEYSMLLNALAPAVKSAILGSTIQNSPDLDIDPPKVFAQIGMYGSFSTTPGHLQNQEILSNLTQASIGAIDGVVGHYYHSGTTGEVSNSNWFFDRFAEWQGHFGPKTLEVSISEWNTQFSTSNQLGAMQIGTMLAMFAEMVDHGVNQASVWPIQQNTPNDLMGDEGELVATFGGEFFRILAQFAADANMTHYENTHQKTMAVFEGLGETIVFATNNSMFTQSWSLQVDTHIDHNFHSPYKIDLFALTGTSDPNGSPIVKTTDVGHSHTSDIHISMPEYSLSALVFPKIGHGVEKFGQKYLGRDQQAYAQDPKNLNDDFSGSANSDWLMGQLGDDTIFGGPGADILVGGDGNDQVFGGAGADLIYASSGSDQLYGESGSDVIIAHDGTFAGKTYFELVHDQFQSGFAEYDHASPILSFTSEAFCNALSKNGFSNKKHEIEQESNQVGSVLIEAGDGRDLIVVDHLDAVINLGAGADVVIATGAHAEIDATHGDDVIFSSGATLDITFGPGGQELVIGSTANTFAKVAGLDIGEDRVYSIDNSSNFMELDLNPAEISRLISAGDAKMFGEDLEIDLYGSTLLLLDYL